MAGTVSSQLTNITLAETAQSTNWDDIGGGPGSSQSDDTPIQGVECRARRIDNNVRGFSYDTTIGQNLSGAGVHTAFWVNILQPSAINANGIELLLGDSATPKAGNWSGYFFPETNYPIAGGWVRVFLDPTRTRDTGAGTLLLAAVRQYGCEFDIADVGGTTPNCQLDRIDYTTGGLLINGGASGSFATFQDFVDADEGTGANRYGVVQSRAGVVFCNARLTIGNATATLFTDSGFAVVFARQPLAAETFLGITVDLQNASSVIDLVGGVIRSGGVVRLGDFLVTGTSGSLTANGTVLDRLRALSLTSASTLSGCTISNSGAITAASAATLTDCSIRSSTAASALIWNVNADTNGNLDGTTFTSGGTGHAIEFGPSSPTSITLTDVNFNGYATVDGSTGNECIWIRRTSGDVTINIAGTGDTPTIRTDGATVNVSNSVSVSVSVRDTTDQSLISGARVYLQANSGGPFPYEAAVSIARAASVVTVTHGASHNLQTGDKVAIRGATNSEYLGVHTVTVVGPLSYTYTITGTPPVTDSGNATAVFLEGITDGTGVISDTKAFISDQPVIGRVRRSTSSPLYKSSDLFGTITSIGFSATASMVRDE